MRIAQVSPLIESVPPQLYGGTERVVSYLTEELVRQGHEVTLFASGDSQTAARLVAPCPRALRLANCIDPLVHHIRLLEAVFQETERFDIIHFHCDYLHFPLSRRQPCPTLTTLHGRLDSPDLTDLYQEYADMPVVSISNAQRGPLPWINWQGTVYHGLPTDLYTYRNQPGDYLAFLGRICPEKGIEQSIKVACRTGIPLKIAAKVDPVDKEYYEQKIKPLLRQTGSLVEFIGEINGKAKDDFLGMAKAVLFLIDWPEPFGLVMIEAMACGTPVIAWRNGSVPEIMEDGVTGFIVDSMEEAIAATERVTELDRAGCRAVFEQRFTLPRMARDYVAIYRRLTEKRVQRPMSSKLFLDRRPITVDGFSPLGSDNVLGIDPEASRKSTPPISPAVPGGSLSDSQGVS